MENVQRHEAEKIFSNFLLEYTNKVLDYTNVPLEETNLVSDFKKYPLGLTHFEDLYDTLLYSNLISKALKLNPSTQTIVDFGAGSSIPTLLALKKSERRDVKAVAVDIDPEAKKIGMRNAEVLGLGDLYTFLEAPMQSVLNTPLVQDSSTLIVSNPPYIPTPEGVSDHHLVPINGGDDGTQYMLDILNNTYPEGTTLALLWGSLTNPSRLLPLIRERYQILHVEAMKVHFGKYTSQPMIKEHLYKLRDEGKVVFDSEERGDSQVVIGTILMAKNTFH